MNLVSLAYDDADDAFRMTFISKKHPVIFIHVDHANKLVLLRVKKNQVQMQIFAPGKLLSKIGSLQVYSPITQFHLRFYSETIHLRNSLTIHSLIHSLIDSLIDSPHNVHLYLFEIEGNAFE